MAIGTPTLGAVLEQTTTTSPINVSYPAVVNAGDYLLLATTSGGSSISSTTTPATWTKLLGLSSTGNTVAPNIAVYRKFAAGTEGGTTLSVTKGTNVFSAQILAFSGVDPTTPEDGVTPTIGDNTTAANTVVIAAATVVTAGAALVTVAAHNSVSITATPPAGFTETADRTVASARAWEVAYQLGVSSGTTGTKTVTWSAATARSIGALFVLRPAVGAIVRPRNVYLPNPAISPSFIR